MGSAFRQILRFTGTVPFLILGAVGSLLILHFSRAAEANNMGSAREIGDAYSRAGLFTDKSYPACLDGSALKLRFLLRGTFPAARYDWDNEAQSCLFTGLQRNTIKSFAGVFNKDFLDRNLLGKYEVAYTGYADSKALGCWDDRRVCSGRIERVESCGVQRRYEGECGAFRCNGRIELGAAPKGVIWPTSPPHDVGPPAAEILTNDTLACLRAACVAHSQGFGGTSVAGNVIEDPDKVGVLYELRIMNPSKEFIAGFREASKEEVPSCLHAG